MDEADDSPMAPRARDREDDESYESIDARIVLPGKKGSSSPAPALATSLDGSVFASTCASADFALFIDPDGKADPAPAANEAVLRLLAFPCAVA